MATKPYEDEEDDEDDQPKRRQPRFKDDEDDDLDSARRSSFIAPEFYMVGKILLLIGGPFSGSLPSVPTPFKLRPWLAWGACVGSHLAFARLRNTSSLASCGGEMRNVRPGGRQRSRRLLVEFDEVQSKQRLAGVIAP